MTNSGQGHTKGQMQETVQGHDDEVAACSEQPQKEAEVRNHGNDFDLELSDLAQKIKALSLDSDDEDLLGSPIPEEGLSPTRCL